MNYRKVWISETEYKIEQQRDDGTIRWVTEDHGAYVAWLDDGNIPEEVEYIAPAPMSDEEGWQQVREQRTALLRDCDWTQLPDVSLTESEVIAWREYRQALRDITNQPDPANIDWPSIS